MHLTLRGYWRSNISEYKRQKSKYGDVLDKKYGIDGAPEQIAFEQNAYDFYFGMILHQARKE